MKSKKLSAMVIFMLFISMITANGSMTGFAADGGIERVEILVPYDDVGIPHPLDTLTADVNFTGESTDVKYQWYESKTEDGEYAAIDGAVKESYIVTWNDEGKYFKVSAETAMGDSVMSAATKQVPDVTYGPVSASGTPGNTPENTPPENLFSVKGNAKQFVLLNTENNDESKFFVLTKDFYGQHLFSTAKDTQKFDVTKKSSVAYYLNNEFYNGANALPEDIKPYINMNHIWYTEAGSMGTDCTADYTTGPQTIDGVAYPSGIALMSIYEYKKYGAEAGMFGYKDGLAVSANYDGWILRSGRKTTWNETGKISAVLVKDAMPGKLGTQDVTYGQSWIRPVFYLNRDFFRQVPLNLSNLGENVKKAIRNTYQMEELLDIYSERELIEQLGYRENYAISNVSYKKAGTDEDLITLQGETGVDAHIDFYNNTETVKDVTAIIAVYDMDNRLADFGTVSFTAQVGETKNIMVSTALPEQVDDNYNVEVYVWDGFTEMTPLCEKNIFGA